MVDGKRRKSSMVDPMAIENSTTFTYNKPQYARIRCAHCVRIRRERRHSFLQGGADRFLSFAADVIHSSASMLAKHLETLPPKVAPLLAALIFDPSSFQLIILYASP